jgi:HAD superfamily hydrolase (TIGR01549 family)
MYNIFDFDGTLVHMDIDYNKMKKELENILDKKIKFIYETINESNAEIKRKCYDLIDTYEIESLKKCKIKEDILHLYINSKYKFVLSRNGLKPILFFFKHYRLPEPDFISCRDNCNNLKPNPEQIDIIINKFPFLNYNNIVIIGDSWHDEELSTNIHCKFIKVV